MHWFALALIGPFLYAITNHIDKILLEKYFKNGGVGTLILISCLLSAIALPIVYYIEPTVFSVDLSNIILLLVIGLLNVAVLWCYLTALDGDEASIIIVFYQLMPVMALVMGYYILGEVLSQLQLLSMAIIILGTLVIAIEIDDDNNFKLRGHTVFYMTAASFFWAFSEVLFKFVALETTVWRAVFWEFLAITLIGVIIFITVKPYRENFKLALRTNSKPLLGWNVVNEVLYMTGNVIISFAIMLAPVSLVLLGDSFQPLFVFAIGIVLTLLFPKIVQEKIEAKHLGQKVIAILITGIGTFLLLSVT